MKKALRIFRIVLIAVVAALLVWLLLKWAPLDNFLTSKFGRTSFGDPEPETLIRISDFNGRLSDSDTPAAFTADGRLYVYFRGQTVDITPPNVSAVFYDDAGGIEYKLRYRDHACYDDERGQLLFVIDVQNVPRLFLAELTTGSVTLLTENVDSFLFVAGTPVFAEGYAKYNTLKAYIDGAVCTLADNARCIPVPEAGGVLVLADNGALGFCELTGGELLPLVTGSGDVVSYVRFGDTLAVYSEFGGTYTRALLTLSTGRVERTVLDNVPDACWSGGEKGYIFDADKGVLSVLDAAGGEEQLFPDLGQIYKVFKGEVVHLSGREVFNVLFATKNGIFEAGAGVGEPVSVLKFAGSLKQYNRHPWLITEYMAVGEEIDGGRYLLSLSDRSFILNKNNPYSWLNRFGSHVFELSYVKDGKLTGCGAPLTRRLVLPESIDGETVLYACRFDTGEVRSLTTLKAGNVVGRDLLKSDGSAKGSLAVYPQLAEGKLFVTVINEPGRSGSYTAYFEADGDFAVLKARTLPFAVSFGRCYDDPGKIIERVR